MNQYGMNPKVTALHLCERVLVDVNTGAWSLICLMDRITVFDFPIGVTCTIFGVITDGRGNQELEFRFTQAGEVMIKILAQAKFDNPAHIVKVGFPVVLPVTHAGLHELECHCAGQLLATCPVNVVRKDE